MKVNDVYDFKYSDEYIKTHSYWGDHYHCFDGQLVVKAYDDGTLYLEDTYWNDPSENRRFSREEALKYGHLTFKCNLDEVVKSSYHDYRYYNEEDIIDLSYQHHSYKRFVRKKDAQRSQAKMLDYADRQIIEMKREIERLQYDIERMKETRAKIENYEDLDKIVLL